MCGNCERVVRRWFRISGKRIWVDSEFNEAFWLKPFWLKRIEREILLIVIPFWTVSNLLRMWINVSDF